MVTTVGIEPTKCFHLSCYNALPYTPEGRPESHRFQGSVPFSVLPQITTKSSLSLLCLSSRLSWSNPFTQYPSRQCLPKLSLGYNRHSLATPRRGGRIPGYEPEPASRSTSLLTFLIVHGVFHFVYKLFPQGSFFLLRVSEAYRAAHCKSRSVSPTPSKLENAQAP